MPDAQPPLSVSAVRTLRLAAALGGVVLLSAGLAAGLVTGSRGFGRVQLLLTVAGTLLLLASLLGPRLPVVHRSAGALLINCLLLVLLAELAATVVLQLLPARRVAGRDWRAQYENAAWYRPRPWAADFWREHWPAAEERRYHAFTLWRSAPHEGRWVNVDTAGLRRTTRAPCASGATRVFLFGGSTMWGWLAHDSGTIASHLQRILDDRAPARFCVENYGQLGYVAVQERLELERQLEAGNVPAVAIFYDGWNDCDIAASNRRAGLHKDYEAFAGGVNAIGRPQPGRPAWRQLALARLAERLRPPRREEPRTAPPPDSASLGSAAASRYLANAALIDALAAHFGFRAYSVLQPWIRVGSKPLSAPERQIVPAGSSPVCLAAYQRLAAAAPRARLVNLAGAFDAETATVYLDEMHVTPDGNAIVASRLAALLDTPVR